MKLQNKKGFTLIELLVVITIIGILATGWVWIYTTQMQGARDTNRLNAMKLLETANHQYFADFGEYPTNWTPGDYKTAVSQYITNFPTDPKAGTVVCNWSGATATTNGNPCGTWYGRADDTNHMPKARFRLATALEKKQNSGTGWMAAKDGWTIEGYYEVFGGEWGSWTTLTIQLY